MDLDGRSYEVFVCCLVTKNLNLLGPGCGSDPSRAQMKRLRPPSHLQETGYEMVHTELNFTTVTSLGFKLTFIQTLEMYII